MEFDNSRELAGISAVVALLAVIIVSSIINKTDSKLASESNSPGTNSLYLTAVQAEQSPVATVNKQVISAETFNKLYLARAENITAKVTIKDVKKALALKRQITGNLIIDALIEQAAAQHNATAGEKEIDARIDALKKTFPGLEKYDLHIAQLPGGENYLRGVARSSILKEKLVDVVGVKLNESTTKALKLKKKGGDTEKFIRNALLIQQLKAQADISNLLEERHMIMLRRTQLIGSLREKIKIASN